MGSVLGGLGSLFGGLFGSGGAFGGGGGGGGSQYPADLAAAQSNALNAQTGLTNQQYQYFQQALPSLLSMLNFYQQSANQVSPQQYMGAINQMSLQNPQVQNLLSIIGRQTMDPSIMNTLMGNQSQQLQDAYRQAQNAALSGGGQPGQGNMDQLGQSYLQQTGQQGLQLQNQLGEWMQQQQQQNAANELQMMGGINQQYLGNIGNVLAGLSGRAGQFDPYNISAQYGNIANQLGNLGQGVMQGQSGNMSGLGSILGSIFSRIGQQPNYGTPPMFPGQMGMGGGFDNLWGGGGLFGQGGDPLQNLLYAGGGG